MQKFIGSGRRNTEVFAMRNDTRGFAALRSITALALVMCLLVTAFPADFARAASTPDQLVASNTKVYIKLSRSVLFFTGTTYGNGTLIQPAVGSVCQLYTDQWYTASDGLDYYSVYYMNKRYNVLRTDVAGDIMTAAQLDAYITGTLWKQSVYSTLRLNMDLVGDVRVHAVQLALSRLGYYKGALDGEYGKGTADAVKQFQKAYGLGSDGSAGPLTQPVLFSLASGGSATPGGSSGSTGGSSSGSASSGSTAPASGTLTTTTSVNLRLKASTSSSRLAIVPAGAKLDYSETAVKNGVTWFKVEYNGLDGWLMGTYVSAGGNSTSPAIGTVSITKKGTRVRKAPNGAKTGYVLSKGTVVDLLSAPTSAAGYTWYHIRTSSGLIGYVRGDCATQNGAGGGTGGGGSSGGGTIVPTTSDKTFVRLPGNTLLFTSKTAPSSGGVTVSAGTVLMMASTSTYTEGGVTYCTLYYNNKPYNAVYSQVSGGIMTASDLNAYVNSLLNGNLGTSLKRNMNLVGDVRVYALQVALNSLGYYTGKLDGDFGSGTQSAVRNFQRAARIKVDGSCGSETWTALRSRLNGGSSSGGGSTGGSGSGVTVTDFGTINKIVKADWNYGDNGGDLFPKSSYATVMDVETGKVFRIYRWSGASHADCVPASLNDTKIMCEIVGYTFNGAHPSSSQLAQIKGDEKNNNASYTWPDFNNAWGSGKDIGSQWDRRPALVNINGTVYATSIYGYPHGFDGSSSFSNSKFPGGGYFYATTAYYGMMCVHFVGSKTHSGTAPDPNHQAAINRAYDYAKQKWPSLCK